MAEDDNNLIFRFTFAGPLNNDWGAPNGMGIHTLDVYIDAAEGGARKLLPGRNAALPEGKRVGVCPLGRGLDARPLWPARRPMILSRCPSATPAR